MTPESENPLRDSAKLTVRSPVAALSATRWLEELSAEAMEAKHVSGTNHDPLDIPLPPLGLRLP